MSLLERRPLRLRGYDYSGAGCYFVTVCVQGRERLFWDGGRAGLEPAPTGDFPRFGGGGNGLSLSDFHLCDP